MKNTKFIGKLAATGLFGAALVAGSVMTANAQNRQVNEEYREWQRAQRDAQREQREYQRTRSTRDYREWQNAQRRVNEEWAEYQRSTNQGVYARGNDGRLYDTRYNNMGNNNTRRYRVYRNGSYYNTDNRGAELLRAAVNNGYSQGYRQGQLDRQRRGGLNYNNNSIYRSGTYGYQSYVDRTQYQYYFQQGFQRGYEDGYNSTLRYGSRSGNGFNILANVLGSILNISDY